MRRCEVGLNTAECEVYGVTTTCFRCGCVACRSCSELRLLRSFRRRRPLRWTRICNDCWEQEKPRTLADLRKALPG